MYEATLHISCSRHWKVLWAEESGRELLGLGFGAVPATCLVKPIY